MKAVLIAALLAAAPAAYGAPAFFAQWDDGSVSPKLQVVNRVMTRNRNVVLTRPGTLQRVSREELDVYLQPTSHVPTDGIVRATASRILPTAGGNTIERARAVYE